MDDETYYHCKNVKNAAKIIFSKIEMRETDAKVMVNACAILDVGKLFINKDIFHKNDDLSAVERELMDLHSYLGYKLLLQNEVPEEIAQIVLFHHGRDKPYIGAVPSFPEKLEEIIKIVHTIDVYEALTEERDYRPGYSRDKAYEIMEMENEKQGNYHMEILDFLHEQNI